MTDGRRITALHAGACTSTPAARSDPSRRHLRAGNRSERTVENYLESLHQAEVFLRRRGLRLEDATKADLEDFLADLLARRSASTAAPATRCSASSTRWLKEEEDVPSPMAKMKPPIVPDQPVPVIPDDGLRRLLKACEGKTFEARRDTVLILLLLDTGARRGELVRSGCSSCGSPPESEGQLVATALWPRPCESESGVLLASVTESGPTSSRIIGRRWGSGRRLACAVGDRRWPERSVISGLGLRATPAGLWSGAVPTPPRLRPTTGDRMRPRRSATHQAGH